MKKQNFKKMIPVTFIICCMALALGCGGSGGQSSSGTPMTGGDHKENVANNDNSQKDTPAETETESTSEASETESTENTYEHNQYYDVVETGSYVNSIGTTYVIHRVLAKKDVSISSTIIAFGPDGAVIGKGSDDVVLTKGEYNYFSYAYESDVSEATFQATAKPKSDSFMSGARGAVEMVQYNQSGDNLYVTFKQTDDDLGAFAKFKLLFYKDDQIVGQETGYFNIYAENLTGKDSTDVAEIWVFGKSFDRVEYSFEP
ncbi:MAG: hypothetical protein J5825_07675 [Lachnospiraceae bacterium]|nr:hypothetical protein [Lachnospiraceae bacterium]